MFGYLMFTIIGVFLIVMGLMKGNASNVAFGGFLLVDVGIFYVIARRLTRCRRLADSGKK